MPLHPHCETVRTLPMVLSGQRVSGDVYSRRKEATKSGKQIPFRENLNCDQSTG
jgi:hypothetical protein